MVDQEFFGAYRPACEVRQAKFSYVPTKENPRGIECRSTAGDLIFAVYAAVESKAVNPLGTSARRLTVSKPSAGQRHDYTPGPDGYNKRDREQERIEAAKRAEQAQRRREEDQRRREQEQKNMERAKADLERRNRLNEEQRLRELPIIKTVGQKVCLTVTGNQRQAVAYEMGKPIFGNPVDRDFRVTGFTDQVAGDRIRVLVGGIHIVEGRSNVRPIDKLEGGDVILERGKPTWDDARNWRICK